MIKAFVIMFNRFTWAKNLCEFLADNKCEVILMDNGSTYGPLLNWYATSCPYKVHHMTSAYYTRGLWESGLIDEYGDKNYLVTDPDLDLSLVPTDFLQKLFVGLENNPDVRKCGLSLKIDDLPKNDYTKEVIEWEIKWWGKPLDKNGYYKSDVGATLALYDSEREKLFYKDGHYLGVRCPEPYVAKHLPWYNTPETITEEEKFYNNSVLGNRGHWVHVYKKVFS